MVQTSEAREKITGTMVGEMALLERAPRSARIVADSEVAAFELDGARFDEMLTSQPRIAEHFMRNCARELSKRLRRTSDDLRRSLD